MLLLWWNGGLRLRRHRSHGSLLRLEDQSVGCILKWRRVQLVFATLAIGAARRLSIGIVGGVKTVLISQASPVRFRLSETDRKRVSSERPFQDFPRADPVVLVLVTCCEL